MYSPKEIAARFIKWGIDENKPLTQMQVQKLVYFAHGLYLAMNKGKLVKEEFEAWKYGPVLPSLYQEFKIYGGNPISNIDVLNVMNNFQIYSLSHFDKDAEYVMKITRDLLKKIDGIGLSAWTHREGSPWQEVFREDVNETIPTEKIKSYFQQQFIKKDAQP